jgi:O-antigen/teichoic acid export membrane protein
MLETNRLTLRHRVLRAGWWTLAGYVLNLSIRFGSNILITRFLAPEMFGLMTIATTVMIGLAMFSDLGMKQNIVQSRRGHEPSFLNTAWTIQIGRGILLWLIAVFLSGIIVIANRTGGLAPGSVYAASGLPIIIIVSSLTVVISGFESTKLFEASRGLSLGRVTIIEILAQMAGLCCMLVWVAFDRSIWVLVFGGIGSILARVTLSHVFLPGAPNRVEWDSSASSELIHFGKWIFLSSVLGFFAGSGDRLLLAGMVSSTALGLYAVASLIPVSLDVLLNKVMAEVSFPAFSEVVRDGRLNLSQAYYRFFVIIAAFSYFLFGVLLTAGQAITHILYDIRYEQAGWMLELQSFILLTIPSRLAVQCYLALGMPKLLSRIIVARLIVLYVATPMGFSLFGLHGAISAIVFSQFAPLPIIYYLNFKHGLFNPRKEVQMFVFVILGLVAGKCFASISQIVFGRIVS